MLRLIVTACCLIALSACATRAPREGASRLGLPLKSSPDWSVRAQTLEQANVWTLDGRAAVAVAAQGWQASLEWRQSTTSSELHLAGPLGIGAQVIKRTPNGISVNGAVPSEAALSQLQDRLGFALPIDDLRFWLLGVPNPGSAFELTRNDQDRALHLTQSDWSIDYDRYMPAGGDILPAHMVLSRDDIRVRIVVDHWVLPP